MELMGYNYNSYSYSVSGSNHWLASLRPTLLISRLLWIKYYDDNASARVISVSVDGYTWSQIVSLSRTDLCTPDQIGVAINAYAGYSSS